MRIFLFALIFSACYVAEGFGQLYPGYKITAYDTSSKGYYFTCPINKQPGQKHVVPSQLILDGQGRVIYFKIFTNAASIADLKIWPNGQMSYSCKNKFYLMDSSFAVIDSVSIKNGYTPDLHDMQILPNGHFLLMGTETDTMDLSGYPYFNHNGSPGSKTALVTCGLIQEQDKNKNVVFEWHARDHYAFDDVDSTDLSSTTNVDWTHFNAFAFDNDSNILLSVRWFNEITKISRKDGSIIWRFGGKRNQFTFLNDTNRFVGQHDIRRISNGDITLFDNGKSYPFHPATAREYKLGETQHTANLVWSYIDNPKDYSLATGNVQRNPNGNTLVDYGIVTNANKVFNAVNAAGSKVFEIAFDDSLVSARSYYYQSLPWKLPRPQITCFLSNGKYFLDAGAGHSKYIWSTGDTTRTIEPTQSDTYFVFVPIGQGGFICSEYFVTSNHSGPCGLTSINENPMEPGFLLFPNPAADELIVQSESFQDKNIKTEIFDMTGKKVYQSSHYPVENVLLLNITSLANGMYVIDINGIKRKIVKE